MLQSLSDDCQIRIALADPTSEHVTRRDEEHDLGGMLPALIRTSVRDLGDIIEQENVELRYHSAPVHNSMVRVDAEMFVTLHLYGTVDAGAPLMHLRRRRPDGIFATFTEQFERLWAKANLKPTSS